MKKKLLLFTNICCFFLFFGITAHASSYSATPDMWNNGTLSDENNEDLYTINLAKDGWVTLTLQGGTIETANMRLKDVDSASDSYYYEGTIERSSETDPQTTESNGIPLKKGTYIIRVARFGAYSSGLQKTNGTYRMKYSFTAANNNETEPNDSFATAMLLTANQKVTGFLAQNDTLDFYQITIPSKQKIQIKCTAMLYTWIKIYDEDLALLKTVEGSYGTSASKPQVLTYEAELAPGTYYIKPSAGTNFNASYGNYILSWTPTTNTSNNSNTNTPSNSNSNSNTNTSSNSNSNSNTNTSSSSTTTNETNTSSNSNTNNSMMIYSPKGTTIKKVQGKSKSIKITIKKPTGQISGYQVQYATNSEFSHGKIKSTRQETLTINKLKAEKKYYIRVRTYQKISGKTYYSSWSKAKVIKTKK